MNSLHWLLTRLGEKLPILAILMMCVLGGILWTIFMLYLPAQEQLVALNKQSMNDGVAQRSQDIVIIKQERVLENFPAVNDVSHAIQVMFALAAKYNLSINEVSYKDEVKAGEPVLRYAINFDLRSSYPVIKYFLTELLATLPYLALQQVSFQREEINQREIDAHFKMSLFLHHE